MFRLRLLGGFAIEGTTGSAPAGLPKRRAEAVLAVLALCGDLGCQRDRLVALVWPESDEARARAGLRDALHAIRRTLGSDAVVGGHVLRLDAGMVDSDVGAFSLALKAGRHAEAVQVYGGPLLDGFHVDGAGEFEHWLDGERTRLAREYAEALEHLGRCAASAGRWSEAAGWWARAVEHDPLNSHYVLRHGESLAAMGDRANAIQIGDAHVLRLRRELDLDPDREFLDGMMRIRRGTSIAPPPEEPASTALAETSPRDHVAPAGPKETVPTTGTETRGGTRRTWWLTTAVALGLLAVAAIARWVTSRSPAPAPRTAIAVLPLRSLGADSSASWFAAGLHDELLSQLAGVASLRVIGRTSVGGYRGSTKPLREIGKELGVGTVVEGSVQVEGLRLRVVVRALDVVTQTGWTEHFERTLDDAFAVQTDIARDIVSHVGATITGSEAEAMAAPPTQNPQAYQLYLQGLEYQRRPGLFHKDMESAAELFARAMELDSTFALARAAFAQTQAAIYDLRYDHTPARIERAQQEVARALRLAPQLPRARGVLGLVYLVRGETRLAVEALRRAVEGAPNDAELWFWLGGAYRSAGNWDSVFVAFDHARRLNPRDATLFHALGDSYHFLHRYREAIAAYREEQALAPDAVQARLSMAWSYVLWKGELDTLRVILEGLPFDGDAGLGGGTIGNQRVLLLTMERRPDSVLALLRVLHPGASPEAVLSRVFQAAIAQLMRRDQDAARVDLDSALAIFDVRLSADSTDTAAAASRCVALALEDRAAELREARCAERATDDEVSRGWMLMRAGQVDSGLAAIDRGLAGPSTTTVPFLRLDPRWDPEWRNPRFRALMDKYASRWR